MKNTDSIRLDWLSKQDQIDFTGYAPLGHGRYVRFSDRFSRGFRSAIDTEMRRERLASKPKKARGGSV